ncbi:MAG: LamG-like jellyroll fold domain-containing protein [Phycisphaerae bacterium]
MFHRLTAASMAALLLTAGLVSAAPSNPTYSWLFDDGSGSTAAAQFGGQAGAVNGATWASDTPLSYGGNNSLQFDGSADVEVASLNQALEGWSQFTLSVWVKNTAGEVDDRAIWSAQEPGDGDEFGLRYDASGFIDGDLDDVVKYAVQTTDGGGAAEASDSSAVVDSWQHLVLTYADGVGPQLYIDSVLETDVAGTPPTSGELADQPRFLIGRGAKDPWIGYIDEVAVWNEALSAEDVEWLNTNSIVTIPEPLTLGLLVIGSAALLRKRRKR